MAPKIARYAPPDTTSVHRHRIAQGGETAVAANEDVVPASELRAAQAKIRELERLIGKQAVDLEILRAARDEVKKRPRFYGVSKR